MSSFYPRRKTYGRSRPKFTRSGLAAYTGAGYRGRARDYSVKRGYPRARVASRKTIVLKVPGITTGMKPETKYVDGYVDNTAIADLSGNDATWAGTLVNPRQQTAVYGCMPVPAQGDNFQDRDGRKIMVKKLQIRGEINFVLANTLTGATTGPNYVRLVLVKDMQTNGATLATPANIIGMGNGSDGNAALTADAACMAPTNPAGWGRFRVLKDKIIRCPPREAFFDGTDGALNQATVPFKITVKPNCIQSFSATTGVVGSVIDNSFHLLAGGATTGGNTISYVARVAFTG